MISAFLRRTAACVLTASSFALAANERPSLDPDFPVRMEDAYPVSMGDAYVKFVNRYAHNADETDTTSLLPELAYGLFPDVDIHLSSTYLIGDGDRTGSGDLNLNSQWMFLKEQQGRWWPALAVEGDLLLPTGVGSDGLDTTVQLLATKTLVWAPTWDSVSLNLTWTHNAVPAADERDNAYNVIVGYTRQVLDDTTFAADVVWERTLSDHTAAETAEVGLIQVFGEHVKVAGGVGVGIGGDAPDFTATVGVIIEK